MAVTSHVLESDRTLLQAISAANQRQEYKTRALLQYFRKDLILNAPNCLFELRNGNFIGTGDYIANKNGVFYFCSANGSFTPVDIDFVYEFCYGCASHLEDYPNSILLVK